MPSSSHAAAVNIINSSATKQKKQTKSLSKQNSSVTTPKSKPEINSTALIAKQAAPVNLTQSNMMIIK
jgi:hypothetical protein